METIHTTIFSTVGDCEKNEQMPHELELTSPHVNQFTCRKCRGNWYDYQLPGGKYPRLKEGEFKLVEFNERDVIR